MNRKKTASLIRQAQSGKSATSTKKGNGRIHVHGWNKQDKKTRLHPYLFVGSKK